MRVIAVDDDRLALLSLKNAIQKSVPRGTVVKGFQSSPDALQYVAQYPVDVAFLDMEAPRTDGLILAKKLQEIAPKINLIFVSTTNYYAMNGWKLHVSGYLKKPLKQTQVKNEINNLRYGAPDSDQTTEEKDSNVGLRRP